MSYTAPDIADDLQQHLQTAGYSVAGGRLADGKLQPLAADEPLDEADAFWFTWTREGVTVEGQSNFETELQAWGDAMAHWFDNASIPFNLEG